MKEKIREVGERLYDMAEHNRITNFKQWNEKMFELLEEAFPDRERVGDLCEEVDDYLHNKYSFGFCDLCGDYINYDDNQWYDTGFFEPEQNEWLEKSLPLWKRFYGDTAVRDWVSDLCPICYHNLTTEEGFRAVPIYDESLITGCGGKSHSEETMGEFLDEAGVKATDSAEEISYALLTSGLAPLSSDYYPCVLADWKLMRGFYTYTREGFLENYFGVKESQYDISKKILENYYE